MIDKADDDLGTVSGTKLDGYQLRMTVSVRERGARQLIVRALEQTQGNRTHAAKLLELSHRALLYKIKDYGV